MKTNLFSFLIFIFCFYIVSSAQTPYTGYIPFPEDSAQWSQLRITPPNIYVTTQYKIKGDTIINGTAYNKIYESYILAYNSNDTILHCFMRQDTAQKKVYVRYPFDAYQDTSEYLLYDFNLHLNDTFQLRLISDGLLHNFVVSGVDTAQFGFDFRRIIGIQPIDTCPTSQAFNCLWGVCIDNVQSWSEGMGSNQHTFIIELFPEVCDTFSFALACYWDHGQYVFGGTFCNMNNGIEDFANEKSFITVSPNPVKDFIEISFSKAIKDGVISISNLQGKLLKQIKTPPSLKLRINLSDLAAGMYLISVNGYVQRFVKW